MERVFAYSSKGIEPLFVLKAPTAEEQFGTALLGIHDTNGDEVPEILVSAPGFKGGLGAQRGRIYIYSGKSGTLLGHITGRGDQDQLGRSIVLVPDLDGDELKEIALGAGGVNGGSIHILSSRDFSPLYRLEGEQGSRRFAEVLAGSPQISEDSLFSIMAGDSRYSTPDRRERGAAYVFNLALLERLPRDDPHGPLFRRGDQ
jgi:hypothetical protein